MIPGERFAVPPNTPFVAGEIADRGPLERAETAAAAAAEVRARDARELHRQQAWRDEAARALNALHEDEGTRPVNAAQLEAAEEARIAAMVPGEDGFDGEDARTTRPPSATRRAPSTRGRSRRSACSRTACRASAWSRRSRTCSCR